MKSVSSTAAIALAAILAHSLARSGDLPPPLSEIRKPPSETKVESEEGQLVTPAPVSPAKRIADPARLCPPDPAAYLAVPDAARLSRDLSASSLGKLLAEPAIGNVLRNNRFGINYLFTDMPKSVVSPSRLTAVTAAVEAATAVMAMAQQTSLAVYLGSTGELKFLFLFDVGLDRNPAFDILLDWETSFNIANPGLSPARGNHSGNYLDVWRVGERESGGEHGYGELAVGFAENIVIIANDAALAAASFALAGGGGSLADLPLGKRLAASMPASASANLVGFVRVDALLKGLGNSPIARRSVSMWADYLGYGGSQKEAFYYGLEFVANGTRETYLLPNAGQTEDSLIEVMSKRLKAIDKWLAPAAVPYQPSPSLYFSMFMENRQLGGILRQERRIFGLSENPTDFINLPVWAKAIFTNNLVDQLTGEVGIAFFPTDENGYAWLMALPCSGNPATLLPKAASSVENNRTVIYSADQNWRKAVCWSPVPASVFRRLPGDYLLLSSSGDIMLSTLDQLSAGGTFSSNRDFSSALADAEKRQGILFYANVPEMLVRQYPNFSQMARSIYPRSAGLNSRPPLALLRRYIRGAMGVVTPSASAGGGEFARLTVQAPFPSLLAMAAGSTLGFPMSLRADGRADMKKSRENMKELWLRMQQFAGRFGHFPETLDELKADIGSELSADEVRELFTAPAALSRMSPEEAAKRSYHYLAGVTPRDEPDIPLIYEAEPWGEDFSGMYPENRNQGPSESGEFLPFRQMILLDGSEYVISERRFKSGLEARLAERE